MVIFILWLILSFVIASAGSSRKIGYGGSLVCCLLFSPLIGGIVTLLSDKKSAGSNIQHNSPATKYGDAIEEAKMLEFKGKKEEALDKYMDGYYLFQTGIKKKQMFVTEKTIKADAEFREKITELEGTIPEDTVNVSDLHKTIVEESEAKRKKGNRIMLIFFGVLVLVVFIFLFLVNQFGVQ